MAVAMPRPAAYSSPAASARLLITAATGKPASTMACILLPRPEIRMTRLFISSFYGEKTLAGRQACRRCRCMTKGLCCVNVSIRTAWLNHFKAKVFCRTYDFLTSAMPYINRQCKKFSILLYPALRQAAPCPTGTRHPDALHRGRRAGLQVNHPETRRLRLSPKPSIHSPLPAAPGRPAPPPVERASFRGKGRECAALADRRYSDVRPIALASWPVRALPR